MLSYWFCSVGGVLGVISDLLTEWEADNACFDSDGGILWVRAFGKLKGGGSIFFTSTVVVSSSLFFEYVWEMI